jgi:hypothetical protein
LEYDAKQSSSTTLSDLRFGLRPIRSTYRIQRAHLVPRSVWIVGGDGWAVIMYSLFEEQRIAEQLAAHRFIDGWRPRRHGT